MNNNETRPADEARGAAYERPAISDLGTLEELTLGSPGGVTSDGLFSPPGTGGS